MVKPWLLHAECFRHFRIQEQKRQKEKTCFIHADLQGISQNPESLDKNSYTIFLNTALSHYCCKILFLAAI